MEMLRVEVPTPSKVIAAGPQVKRVGIVRSEEPFTSSFLSNDSIEQLQWDAIILVVALVAWAICRLSARRGKLAKNGVDAAKHIHGMEPNRKPIGLGWGAGMDQAAAAELPTLSCVEPADSAALLAQIADKNRCHALDLYGQNRNRVDWSALSSEVAQHTFFNLCIAASRMGKTDELNQLLKEMKRLKVPISLELYVSLLRTLTGKRMCRDALALWKQLRAESFEVTDRVVWSCLLFSATEEGMFDLALFFFDKLIAMGDVTEKDYGNAMRVYASRQEGKKAFEALQHMKAHGLKPDNVIYNTAFATCCIGGKHLDLAQRIFNAMKEAGDCVDIVTYNTFMKGYVQAKRLDEAFGLLVQMEQDGFVPSSVTFGTLLNACISQDGCMERAHEVFRRMSALGCEMNTILYTTLIKGFMRARDADKALGVYEEMRHQGVEPDNVTFSLLIKTLGDAGRLEKALFLFQTMFDQGIQPDECVFNNLLSGCVVAKNLALGEKVFQDMEKVGVQASNATCSIMMKLYAECQALPKAQALLECMEVQKGVTPEPRLYLQLMTQFLRQRQWQIVLDIFQSLLAKHGPPPEDEFARTLNSCVFFNLYDLALQLSNLMLEKGGRISSDSFQKVANNAAKKKKFQTVSAVVELACKHGLHVNMPPQRPLSN